MLNNNALGYIHDGYTRKGYIAAKPMVHPELRFEYRPVLTPNRSVILHQMTTLEPDEVDRLAAQSMKAHLVWWDLQDHTGKSVDISVPNLLRVEPNLFVRLFEINLGRALSDEDPQWSEHQKDDRGRQALERALSGATPELEEETDVGNFKAGCG
jgi:hypothetical protein